MTTTSTVAATTTSSSGTGGTGGVPECQAMDACSDMNPCTADSCDTAAGKCVHENVPDGPTTEGLDTPKDCNAPACVNGVLGQAPNDADLPDDGNVCTVDTCVAGAPKNDNLPTTTKCGASLFCDGNGGCVGCVTAAQCAPPGTCQFAACENTLCKPKDSPAGQSCGGSKVCDGTGNCVGCISDNGCNGTNICINNNCATSCNTGVKDGKESDVDCGGPCMTNCANGKMCFNGGDCTSGLCTGGICMAAPTCTDLMKNGTESDVDCGGTCALKCATGKMCGVTADCAAGTCPAGVCVAPGPTCTDLIKNGTESDVDCGGTCTLKCATGKMCGVTADCAVGTCPAGVCVP